MQQITKYIIPISLAFFTIIFFTMASKENNKRVNCIDNQKFYEPMLTPTKNDTLIWEKIKGRFSKSVSSIYNGELIAITRGLADTSLLTNSAIDKFPYYNQDFKSSLAFSPLVIKGKIIDMYYEDTVNPKNLHFLTNYLIEIKQVYKSKYQNVKIGDRIIAKTHLYGSMRSKKDKKLYKTYGFEVQPYIKDKTYFFILDKYWGMMVTQYLTTDEEFKSNPFDDIYCPNAFYLGLTEHAQSEQYESGRINDEMISFYLNSSTIYK